LLQQFSAREYEDVNRLVEYQAVVPEVERLNVEQPSVAQRELLYFVPKEPSVKGVALDAQLVLEKVHNVAHPFSGETDVRVPVPNCAGTAENVDDRPAWIGNVFQRCQLIALRGCPIECIGQACLSNWEE
jgi:hypothetical protein